jgi:hypothetical protein
MRKLIDRVRNLLMSAWGGLTVIADPLSKVAQIVGVIIAAIWTWHISEITGEYGLKPEVHVNAETFDYSAISRLVAIHVKEQNVGKIPVMLNGNGLKITIKKIPDGLKNGYANIDKLPVLYEQKDFLRRYEEVQLDPGVEFEEVETFLLEPGTYHIEATVYMEGTDDDVNGIAVIRVK